MEVLLTGSVVFMLSLPVGRWRYAPKTQTFFSGAYQPILFFNVIYTISNNQGLIVYNSDNDNDKRDNSLTNGLSECIEP